MIEMLLVLCASLAAKRFHYGTAMKIFTESTQ
jgi:hypothetical protein